MKKIALTQRLIENDSYKETREALDIKYSSLVNDAGFLPVILPYEIDFKTYFLEFEIEGILLTGGNDLNSMNGSALSEKRDSFEKKLIDFAIHNNIPLFGICRGMQIIAEYFGSTFKKTPGQVAINHPIKVNNNSKYSEILKQLKVVNSFHNYAIDTLGTELTPSAFSPNGIIKAIESEKYHIFAQMWHSERESPFVKNEIAIIIRFFNENSQRLPKDFS